MNFQILLKKFSKKVIDSQLNFNLNKKTIQYRKQLFL